MTQSARRDQFNGAAPAVSVIVPCFNAEATLRDTLTSVRGQTFRNFDVILVDDGSTDGTAGLLAGWALADGRFRVVTLPNGGPSRARNHAALDIARGRYIAFLDSDDIWPSNKLAQVVKVMDADPTLGAVYGRTAFFRDRPELARTVSQVRARPLTPGDLLRGNAVCTMSNVVVRREVFRATGGFDPSIVYSEDLEWLVRLTAAGVRLQAIDATLVYYRSTDAGISINVEKMCAGWKSAADSARRAGCDLSVGEFRAAEATHMRLMARRALRGLAPRGAALKLVLRGVAHSPFGFFADPARALLTLLAACIEPLLPAGLRRLALNA